MRFLSCFILIQIIYLQCFANEGFYNSFDFSHTPAPKPIGSASVFNDHIPHILSDARNVQPVQRYNPGTVTNSPYVRNFDLESFRRDSQIVSHHLTVVTEFEDWRLRQANPVEILERNSTYRTNRLIIHTNGTHLISEGNQELRRILSILTEMKEQVAAAESKGLSTEGLEIYLDKEGILGKPGAHYELSALQERAKDVHLQVSSLADRLKETEDALVKSIPNFDKRLSILDPLTRKVTPELDARDLSKARAGHLLTAQSFSKSNLGLSGTARRVFKQIIKR